MSLVPVLFHHPKVLCQPRWLRRQQRTCKQAASPGAQRQSSLCRLDSQTSSTLKGEAEDRSWPGRVAHLLQVAVDRFHKSLDFFRTQLVQYQGRAPSSPSVPGGTGGWQRAKVLTGKPLPPNNRPFPDQCRSLFSPWFAPSLAVIRAGFESRSHSPRITGWWDFAPPSKPH